MPREFVISDIHGCYKTLKHLIEEILQPSLSDNIYLLGDYVNKGPSIKATLDFIMDLIDRGFRLFPLMGNHEKNMLDAIDDSLQFHLFVEKGGVFTLRDFGVEKVGDIPEKYLSFIQSLPYYIDKGDWLLVHAGFNFSIDDPFSDKDAMLNIREMENPPQPWHGKKIIHGHVPVTLGTVIDQMKKPGHWNYFLDAGCVYPYRDGMGFLTALELQENRLYVKECIDDVEAE
jgi:serine/threonine protein phosphatase 1